MTVTLRLVSRVVTPGPGSADTSAAKRPRRRPRPMRPGTSVLPPPRPCGPGRFVQSNARTYTTEYLYPAGHESAIRCFWQELNRWKIAFFSEGEMIFLKIVCQFCIFTCNL